MKSDRGSAVAEFALVSILLVTLLLAVVQVGVYLHVRNVVAASAAEGARYAANADVSTADGAERAREIAAGALGRRAGAALRCAVAEESGAGGVTLVSVRCRGGLPAFFAPAGRLLPIDVTGRSMKEGV